MHQPHFGLQNDLRALCDSQTSAEEVKWGKRRTLSASMPLFLRRSLAPSHLLGFKVLVEKVECLLIAAGTADDGEHAFPGFVVGSLGNGDAGARTLANLRDLTSATTDDAADHVRRNTDVLRLNLLAILRRHGHATGRVRSRSAIVLWEGIVAKVGSIAGAGIGTADAGHGRATDAIAETTQPATSTGADAGIVEDGTGAALPVVNETLSNLPDGFLDSFGSALHFDDALRRLREHFFLRHHSHSRGILNILDLQTLSTDDGSHLVVGDEQTDRYRPRTECQFLVCPQRLDS